MTMLVMPAGDGTHRLIEADAIRALLGYLDQVERENEPVAATPDLDLS